MLLSGAVISTEQLERILRGLRKELEALRLLDIAVEKQVRLYFGASAPPFCSHKGTCIGIAHLSAACSA